ncbi:MAG: polyprenyl synthetase family protein [Betaproteobacteria bacterium]|nr:polyprenyl synthetase family protein [Betaproteobacteria bacterium]
MGSIADPGLRDAPELVQSVLDDYGALTRNALERYLPGSGNRPYLDDLLCDYPRRGGKMMRSSLCIATARAFGARIQDVLPSAVAIELLHNAMLIHDDIEDGSDERRGQPALHRKHGLPLALNAGDSLSLLSLKPLRENVGLLGPQLAMRIFDETERMAWESAEGQALELGWRHDNRMDVTDDDYLTMILKKTCWLATIHPCRVGALIGTRGNTDLDALFRFGFFLGAAFQITDDVLNLEGDHRYGKEIDGDLWEGKRTLMVVHALARGTEAERIAVKDMLAVPRERRTAEQVSWLRALIERTGALDYARDTARGLAGAALHEYQTLFEALPPSRDREFVRGMVTWVLARTH